MVNPKFLYIHENCKKARKLNFVSLKNVEIRIAAFKLTNRFFEITSEFVHAVRIYWRAYIFECVLRLFSSDAFFFTYTHRELRTRKLVHWRVLSTRT